MIQVRNIKGLHYQVAKIWGSEDFSFWQRLNSFIDIKLYIEPKLLNFLVNNRIFRYFSSSSREIFPRLYSFSWGMQTTFTTIALFITLIYWAFLHRYVVEYDLLPGTWMKVLNVFLHAINSVRNIIIHHLNFSSRSLHKGLYTNLERPSPE